VVQKFSRIKYIMNSISPFLYMDAVFGPIEEEIKKLFLSIQVKFFSKTTRYAFLTTKRMKNFWKS